MKINMLLGIDINTILPHLDNSYSLIGFITFLVIGFLISIIKAKFIPLLDQSQGYSILKSIITVVRNLFYIGAVFAFTGMLLPHFLNKHSEIGSPTPDLYLSFTDTSTTNYILENNHSKLDYPVETFIINVPQPKNFYDCIQHDEVQDYNVNFTNVFRFSVLNLGEQNAKAISFKLFIDNSERDFHLWTLAQKNDLNIGQNLKSDETEVFFNGNGMFDLDAKTIRSIDGIILTAFPPRNRDLKVRYTIQAENAKIKERDVLFKVRVPSNMPIEYVSNAEGMSCSQKGNENEAIKCFDKALSVNSKFTPALFNKGMSLYNINNTIESEKCLIKAIQADSSISIIWGNLAVVQISLNKYNNAYRSLVKALHINPKNKIDLNNLVYLIKKTRPDFDKTDFDSILKSESISII